MQWPAMLLRSSLVPVALLLCVLQAAGSVDAKVHNITVYRVTPWNYTGVRNMDTGDAPGDIIFGLYEFIFPLVCPDFPDVVNCRNVPILDIPNFNVYTEFVVEVDARVGRYSECNPDPDTGIFQCAHLFSPDICWYDKPEWNTSFAPLCDRSQCLCPAVEKLSVGGENCPLCDMWPPQPKSPDWPETCQGYDEVGLVGTKRWRKPFSPYGGSAACCARCSREASRGGKPGCVAWSYVKSAANGTNGRGTCHLWESAEMTDEPCPSGTTCVAGERFLWSQPEAFWVGELAQRLNGWWYSFTSAGECAPGQRPAGDGTCFWRLVEERSTVNATCVSQRLSGLAQERHSSCFESCGKEAKVITSRCFVHCLFEALNGNSTAVPPVPATPTELIVAAFTDAFKSPEEGGCPGPISQQSLDLQEYGAAAEVVV